MVFQRNAITIRTMKKSSDNYFHNAPFCQGFDFRKKSEHFVRIPYADVPLFMSDPITEQTNVIKSARMKKLCNLNLHGNVSNFLRDYKSEIEFRAT